MLPKKASPNHGVSQPDAKAVGKEALSIAEWRAPEGIDVSCQIRLVKLSHMRYQLSDLLEITTFLREFGTRVVKETDDKVWFWWLRRGSIRLLRPARAEAVLGGTFEVESYQDLEKAAQIPGASQVQELKDAPGGGYNVTLTDPEGFPLNLMYGQTPVERGKVPEKLVLNFETEKPRLRSFQRFQPGPAAVHKLGHYGLCIRNFQDQVRLYTRTVNLVPTDFLYQEEPNGANKKDVAIFAHIDRGADHVDHHTFFVSTNENDFDTQQLGHQWLAKKCPRGSDEQTPHGTHRYQQQ